MAKLPEEGYVVSIGTEGYWVSDGFAELLIQLLQYGDTSNVILTTKTAIQDEKMKLLSDIHSLSIEKEKLKEELNFVRNDNTKFEEDVKQLKNDLEESQRNNIELAADVKALEIRFDAKGTSSVEFRKDIQKLREENIKLMNVCNYLQRCGEGLSGSVEMLKKENKELKEQFTMDDSQKRCLKLQEENETLKKKFAISERLRKDTDHDWCKLYDVCKDLEKERDELKKQNEYLSGSIGALREMHTKEKAELKEQLEASSDLNMTNELANIFGEYTDAEQKNHNILIGKLAKFQDKHKLICVAGELKRG